MPSAIDPLIKKQVIHQWLAGVSIDRIAVDNHIQNDTINALMKLQFYGITEDQILKGVQSHTSYEHDFIPKTLKGTNNFVICCVTCMQCYCHICGKLIE